MVAAYVDQFPEKELSRQRAAEFGFPIYPSIAKALRCGGDKLAVDAVLIIGEHGNYPIERTLLTTGLVEAGVRSLATGQKRLETPHLAVRYQATRESTFARS